MATPNSPWLDLLEKTGLVWWSRAELIRLVSVFGAAHVATVARSFAETILRITDLEGYLTKFGTVAENQYTLGGDAVRITALTELLKWILTQANPVEIAKRIVPLLPAKVGELVLWVVEQHPELVNIVISLLLGQLSQYSSESDGSTSEEVQAILPTLEAARAELAD